LLREITDTEGTDPLVDTTRSIQGSSPPTFLLPLPPVVMMSPPPDIKPTIASNSAPRPNPSPLPDIKPSLTDISRSGNPIDLTKHKHSIIEERRKLEEEFRLRRAVGSTRGEFAGQRGDQPLEGKSEGGKGRAWRSRYQA
jgi:hypothetical protein